MVFPDAHPAYGRLLVDVLGNLWVERPSQVGGLFHGSLNPVAPDPTLWDVFDAAGVWLGSVELPAHFFPMEFAADYVTGVWKDEVDVEFVQVHRIVRPMSP